MSQRGPSDRPPGAPLPDDGPGAGASIGSVPPVPALGRPSPPAEPDAAHAPETAAPAGDQTQTPSATTAPAPPSVKHTRASATYIGVAVGLVILVLIIVFIAQNLHEADVHFLSFHFRLAVGLIILASAVAGGLIVLLVSLVRVVQLRRMARRHRQAHDQA